MDTNPTLDPGEEGIAKEEEGIANQEERIPNTRGSCTIEEAVARLLGWLQSPISKRYIQITELGVSVDQLPLMSRLYDSLDQTLYEVREAARADLLAAAEAVPDAKNLREEDIKVLEEKTAAVEEADRLIVRARGYRLDLEDAAFRPDSPLVVNPAETARSGVQHYTLRSLDRWTLDTYGISLLDPSRVDRGDRAVKEVLASATESACESDAPSASKGDGSDSAGGVSQLVPSETADGIDLSKTKARGLYVTLGLLVREYVARTTGYARDDGKPNVSALAGHLVQCAKSANAGDNLSGQAVRTITDRIKEALKVLDQELPLSRR